MSAAAHSCALCGRKLPSKQQDALVIYSTHTRAYYCPPGDWATCEARARRKRLVSA